MKVMQDKELDKLLAVAANQAPRPSAGFMDRVLADALSLQPKPAELPQRPSPTAEGLVARIAVLFGGAPALAGVCSAAVVGLAFGYLNPTTLDVLTGGLTGAETLEMFPSADFLTTEG
ncbi:MAG: hypothetical protein C0524_08320 [Rhodobacter sp.]|nr:hypothetical protein [Rhodobacter sp.]